MRELERRFRMLGIPIGADQRDIHRLIADALDAAAKLHKRALKAATRARRFHEAGDAALSLLHYRQLATTCWWLGQQWTRFVPAALLGAAECALVLRQRPFAGRLLSPADFSDAELIEGARGLKKLLVLGHRAAFDMTLPTPSVRRSGATRGRKPVEQGDEADER